MSLEQGSYRFEVTPKGHLIDNAANLEKLRRLFRDGALIGGEWGPGNPGDFDHGSWHILCHLAGGSAVFRSARGLAWCAITHEPTIDQYPATLTHLESGQPRTLPVRSAEAAQVLADATCMAFIEGTSLGHISARGVVDPPGAYNGWPRQLFDQSPRSADDGGTVWEHWSTTRDIRVTSTLATSVLQAWLALVALLGGRFVAAIARGRREHKHPRQLVGLVRAGVLTEAEATWEVTPDEIPEPAQWLLHEARPADCLEACQRLPFTSAPPQYFMFARRIDRWSPSASVKRDLQDH